MKKIIGIIYFWAACSYCLQAQSYHAINGSPYAGANAMYNNPAATVNSFHKWHVTIFSIQSTISNSTFEVQHASLLNTNSANAVFTNNAGNRILNTNFDVNLLNITYKIDKKNAVGFGIRGRTYNHFNAYPFSFNDTITTTQGFLATNTTTPFLQAYGIHSGWIEFNFNYSKQLIDNDYQKLSAGLTLGYQKSVSGVYGDIEKLSFNKYYNSNTSSYQYILTGGAATAMYSSNYDAFNNATAITPALLKSFLSNTNSSFVLNAGVEYIIKDPSLDITPLNATHYDWKFGFSILDVGKNSFNPVNGSFKARIPLTNINDSTIINQLSNVASLSRARDSLSKSFQTIDSIKSIYSISNPTRIILNADKNLGNHFYINGELSINLFSSNPRGSLALKTNEINLVTITPRWEKRNIGFYLPIQFNNEHQIWVGGAFKLGPLIMGVHSLDFYKWFKMGTQTFNGGFYLMLNVFPFGTKEKEETCPPH